jgi:RND family efflux transporter MFP subunit
MATAKIEGRRRMIHRFGIGTFLLILCMSFSGCSDKGESKDTVDKTAGKPPVAVEVTKVAITDLTEGIDVVGSLSPKFSADVKSEYAGIVTEVYVTEWVKVKKGTPLAKIDTREMEIFLEKAAAALEMARANLLQAQVAGNRAEREYDRLLKLKEAGLVTQQNLDDGLTEKEAASARIAAAKAQLKAAEEDLKQIKTRLSKTIIYSPIDGVISFRGVNVGDLVGEMGSPKIMFHIINTRILDLTVAVPSKEMSRVNVGQPLTFSTDAIPEKTFTGKVMFINPVVNESDRSVKITAEVNNLSEELKGGLYVKGRIITGKRTGVLRVPRVALLSWDVVGKKGDLFLVEGEIATRRTIQTGSVMGDFVEVTSGLSPGEAVVVRGGFNLKDGDRVNVTQVNGG